MPTYRAHVLLPVIEPDGLLSLKICNYCEALLAQSVAILVVCLAVIVRIIGACWTVEAVDEFRCRRAAWRWQAHISMSSVDESDSETDSLPCCNGAKGNRYVSFRCGVDVLGVRPRHVEL